MLTTPTQGAGWTAAAPAAALKEEDPIRRIRARAALEIINSRSAIIAHGLTLNSILDHVFDQRRGKGYRRTCRAGSGYARNWGNCCSLLRWLRPSRLTPR